MAKSLMESMARFITVYIDTLFFRHAMTLSSLHEILISLTSATTALEYVEGRALPELLARQPDPTIIKARELLGKTNDQVHLSLYMAQNLMDSLVESTEEPLTETNFVRIDLRGEVLKVIDLWQEEARRKEVSFRLEMDTPVHVAAHKGLLLHLLNNIVSNAVKYSYHTTPRSKPRFIRVSLSSHDPGFRTARAKLSISNYGLGLTVDERDKLGQLGFRGSAAKREQPLGFGVGVHVAKRLARLHNGKLVYTWKKLDTDSPGNDADNDGSSYLVICDLTLPLARKAAA